MFRPPGYQDNISNEKKIQEKNRANNVQENLNNILLYALSLATGLAFNDFVLSIFDSFHLTNHIIAKSIYLLVMLGTTILLAYYWGSTVKGTM